MSRGLTLVNGWWLASQTPRLRVPLEHREVDDPAERQQVGVGQLQALAELAAQLVQRRRRRCPACRRRIPAGRPAGLPSARPAPRSARARRTWRSSRARRPLPPPASRLPLRHRPGRWGSTRPAACVSTRHSPAHECPLPARRFPQPGGTPRTATRRRSTTHPPAPCRSADRAYRCRNEPSLRGTSAAERATTGAYAA